MVPADNYKHPYDKAFVAYVSEIVRGISIRTDAEFSHIQMSLDRMEYTAYEKCYQANVPVHAVIRHFMKTFYTQKGL